MEDVTVLVKTLTKSERQIHLKLNEPCLERGGTSTNHKGVLAQFLNTTIPHGTEALLCHACHNPKCSNPRHVYWGTYSDNLLDSYENGREAPMSQLGKIRSPEERVKISEGLIERYKKHGPNNPKGQNGDVKKLTKDQALEIYHSKLSCSKLGEMFSLTKGMISLIKNKKSYLWIHNE